MPDWLIVLLPAAAYALWWLALEVRWRRALAADAQKRRAERAADIAWMDEIEERAKANVERILGNR